MPARRRIFCCDRGPVGDRSEPEPTSVLFDHLGPAVPVFVNFGISGVERILRELRAALSRRGREMVLARHVARQGLRDGLKNDVTALLLSCDIALQESELTEVALERLRKIRESRTRSRPSSRCQAMFRT